MSEYNLAVSYKPDNMVRTQAAAKNSPSLNLQTASSRRLNLDTPPPVSLFSLLPPFLLVNIIFHPVIFHPTPPSLSFCLHLPVINAVLTSRHCHSLHNSNSPSFQHRLRPPSSFKWLLLPLHIVINGGTDADIICPSRALLCYSTKPITVPASFHGDSE